MKGTIIKYEIDNFSGILSVDDFRICYNHNRLLGTRNKSRKPAFIENKMLGCYFIYNEFKEIIYIGKSSNCIRQRLIDHLFRKLSQYPRMVDYNLRQKGIRKEAVYFAFINIEKNMLSVVEPFLIDKYKPKYNVEFNNC